ncbi:MAG TPA: M13 family metallopeptidase [Bacteroidales bacterium]|nr:M13 family metallopeptidase [Bacteroidales bacterium]
MALDRSNMDTSVKPGDDFYIYANGGWLKNNPLPGEFSRYGAFDKLGEDNQKMVRTLIEEAAAKPGENGSIAYKVGTYYKTGMDTLKIDEQGITPLNEDLAKIQGAKTIDDIQDLISEWHTGSNPVLFYLYGAPDRKNSEMVIANLYQGGLGLTDVNYYRDQDPKAKEIRETYVKYIAQMMGLAGESQEKAAADADLIMKMETRLANASMTRLERRDPHATYNKMTLAGLETMSPNFNWDGYLKELGLPGLEEINVGQPEFFKEVSTMMNDLPVDNWKVYLKWNLVNQAAPLLSSDLVDAHFDFYGKYLSGRKVNRPRWKRVVNSEDYALGEAIGEMFVEKHFPPEAKERMLDLVSNLKLALGDRINTLEWMSEPTKEEALKKLEAMNVKIGYPDEWRDYSDLEVKNDSYYKNVRRAAHFNFLYDVNKIGKPVDPNEWGMTPQTVNAYYSPSRNEIVFPAGILQPPFFYLDADDAVNYGAIGVVIGHEMSHGFDDQGRQYDKDGNLRDWWTSDDADKFTKRAQVLIDQFDQYNVLDTTKASGELTIGENIADLGGLNISYTALQKAWEKNPPEKEINGFTPEQRFFLAYSHVWAQNITDKEILRRTKEDVHSLGRFRVNGPLPNLQAFYDAFSIPENSKMYIPVKDRAIIW